MQSKIKELAQGQGIDKPSDLMYLAHITWPTASKIWTGNLSRTQGDTLRRVARVLRCCIDDLFEMEEAP